MMADEHLGHFPCLGTHKLNSTEKLCQHHFANGSIDQVQDYWQVRAERFKWSPTKVTLGVLELWLCCPYTWL